MNLILLSVGILLLLLILVDLLYTSFSARGAGYLTRWTTKTTWTFLVFLSTRLQKTRYLQYAGLLIICLTLLQWLALIWLANVFIVASDEQSILSAKTNVPAIFLEKVYTTGYTLSTLGNGDFIGGSEGWKIYISLTAYLGIVTLTVSLTYLVQVLSNVKSKRTFGSTVFSLGNNPQLLLVNAWGGRNFSSLNHHLLQLGSQITALSEAHLSYPVLHFYYSPDRSKSVPVAIAILDEALSIIYTCVPKDHWPDHLILHSTRQTISSFLQTLKAGFVKEADIIPPLPDFSLLKKENIPVLEGVFEADAVLQERRKLLLGLLQDEGRSWNAVNI